MQPCKQMQINSFNEQICTQIIYGRVRLRSCAWFIDIAVLKLKEKYSATAESCSWLCVGEDSTDAESWD